MLSLGLSSYPLHGYMHTLLASFSAGLILAYAMFRLERRFHIVYRTLLLEPDESLDMGSFMVAGVTGTMLHVVMDSPLYDDIRPFYPLAANPVYSPDSALLVYSICVWLGMFGVVYYLCLGGYHASKRLRRSKRVSSLSCGEQCQS